ncbi:MAG: hypothetical protein QNJ98_13780 [Planctomycetota bacterium]|nr:hypothetical protein [Planctomycetota bacterium]
MRFPHPLFGLTATVLVSTLLTACGGGGGSETPPPPFVPDVTFGTSGLLTTQGSGNENVFIRADASLDGSVAIVGQTGGGGTLDGLVIEKRLPDGTPDASFSGDGKLDLPNLSHDPRAIHLNDQDGSVLVAADNGSGYTLFKFLASGAPDSSFGLSGERTVNTGSFMKLGGMIVDPDGRIFVAGSVNSAGYAMRFTSGGDPDPTWNGGAAYTFQIFGSSTSINAVTRRGGGGYLVAGRRFIPGDDDWLFVGRFGANGLPVLNYGSAGFLMSSPAFDPRVSGIVARPDGRAVVFGVKNGTTPFALGVSANGGLDPQIGIQELDGVQVGYGRGSSRRMSDGEITFVYSNTITQAITLWRLLEDGTSDPAFGTDGVHTFSLGPQQYVFNAEPHDLSGGFFLLGRQNLPVGSAGFAIHMVEP